MRGRKPNRQPRTMATRGVFLSAAIALLGLGSPKIHAHPSSSAPETLLVTGRVLDSQRYPVENARVVLAFPNEPSRTAKSDSQGRFRIPSPRRHSEHVLEGSLVAQDDGHRVSVARVRLPPRKTDSPAILAPRPGARSENWRTSTNAGDLILEAGHPITVRVDGPDGPLLNAAVRAEWNRHRIFLEETRTDGRGEARFSRVPIGALNLIASRGDLRGTVSLDFTKTPAFPVPIVVRPTKTLRVTVREGSTGAPVEGAEITLFDDLEAVIAETPSVGHLSSFGRYIPRLPLYTGPKGTLLLKGIGASQPLIVRAQAHGLTSLPGGLTASHTPFWFVEKRVPKESTEVLIELYTNRFVLDSFRQTWLLDSEKNSLAKNDAPVTIASFPDHLRPLPGRQTRIENGSLITSGTGPSAFALAVLENGSAACLKSRTLPLRFLPPVRARVQIFDPAGNPAPGIQVGLHRPRFPTPFVSTTTGNDGTSGFRGIHPTKVEVWVREPGRRGKGHLVGTFDLTRGDLETTFQLPQPRKVLLHVRLKGRKALPSRYEIWQHRGPGVPSFVHELKEDPGAGLVHFWIDDAVAIAFEPKGYRGLRFPIPRGAPSPFEFHADLEPIEGPAKK